MRQAGSACAEPAGAAAPTPAGAWCSRWTDQSSSRAALRSLRRAKNLPEVTAAIAGRNTSSTVNAAPEVISKNRDVTPTGTGVTVSTSHVRTPPTMAVTAPAASQRIVRSSPSSGSGCARWSRMPSRPAQTNAAITTTAKPSQRRTDPCNGHWMRAAPSRTRTTTWTRASPSPRSNQGFMYLSVTGGEADSVSRPTAAVAVG